MSPLLIAVYRRCAAELRARDVLVLTPRTRTVPEAAVLGRMILAAPSTNRADIICVRGCLAVCRRYGFENYSERRKGVFISKSSGFSTCFVRVEFSLPRWRSGRPLLWLARPESYLNETNTWCMKPLEVPSLLHKLHQ